MLGRADPVERTEASGYCNADAHDSGHHQCRHEHRPPTPTSTPVTGAALHITPVSATAIWEREHPLQLGNDQGLHVDHFSTSSKDRRSA
jgi:hypothetical protein